MDSFRLSPLTSRRSVLNDNTDIEEPRRHSWWKNLNDTSRDILEVLENDKQDGAYNVMEEYMDGQVLSQEEKQKKDKHETLDLPDSSDSESITSIVIPQRKLFSQKENQPRNKFAEILGTRETVNKHNKTNIESDKNDKTIVVTKKLFGQSSKPRSKPAFPTELLRFSPDKTVNKTAGEVKGQVRNLFGNRAAVKRKNKFADFIASESEEEPEIQPKVFAFQKKHDVPSRRVSTASRGGRDASPTSSVTTDIDMDDWKLLPSSTMVPTQLEAMMVDSPVKKVMLSKLSEGKESEAVTNSTALTNKSKQSNKSIVSKNKSKLSTSKTSSNKAKMSPEVNTSIRKSPQNRTENRNEYQNIEDEAVGHQDSMTNNVQTDKNAAINKSSKSVTAKNKSKMNISNNTSTKSMKQSNHNEILPGHDSNLDIDVNEDQDLVTNNAQSDRNAAINNSKQSNKSVTAKNKSTVNNSKNVSTKSIKQSDIDETLPGNDVDAAPNDIDNLEHSRNMSTRSKSFASKNSSKISTANKSKTSPKIDESVQKSKLMEEAIPEIEDQEIELKYDENNMEVDADDEPPQNLDLDKADNVEENDNYQINISLKEQSNTSVTMNRSKTSNLNQSKTTPKANKSVHKLIVPENERQELNIIQEKKHEDKPNEIPDDDHNEGNEDVISLSNKTSEINKSTMSNKPETALNLNESGKEKDFQELELDDNQEDRLALAYSDDEPMDKENENLSQNTVDKEIDNVDNSQNMDDEVDEKIINESTERNAREEKENNDESSEAQNESQVSIDNYENLQSDVDEPEDGQEDENEEIENEQLDETDNNEEGNASKEVESEAHEETENEDNDEDENEEEIEVEEENESQENQDVSQEIEESHEVEDEGQASEEEENESQENVNNSVDEVIDESNGQNGESTNVEENNEINATEESPNMTHDTTGRNRRKDETHVRSPEAVLKNSTDHIDSFTAKGRNTSIRRTTMLKSLNLRPSLAPPRDSTGLSDGTRNSSAEGSGWDSHRTTRKTLRQTFGKDFTPRKSLRALVMEKSAKQNTVFNDINDVDMPRANSTELPEDSNREEEFENPHEISKRTRQTTLEMYLQKIKKQNMEKKKKLEEEVRNSLSAPSTDVNVFKVPSRPFVLKRAKPQSKPKTSFKSTIPLENLPKDLVEDMKYRPPKRFQPGNASWITKRLYKFLESKLEPKYDYKARVRAEKLVETIYNFVKDLRRHEVAPQAAVDVLKQEMARLCVVDTHFEFYQFFHDYLPREVRVKVVPDVVNKIPLPRHGVFTEIQRGNTVQG